MMLHVTGQGKRGYLTGKIPPVDEDSPGYDSWCIDDCIVKGWLLKTMDDDLRESFLDLPTAKDVWESASQMYYDASDESQIYELRCKSTRIKQSGRDLSCYFAELKKVWQELDCRRPINMKCPDDVKLRQDEVQKDRVYDFLAGLDDELNKIRGDVLRVKPLPKLEEVYSYVRKGKSQ